MKHLNPDQPGLQTARSSLKIEFKITENRAPTSQGSKMVSFEYEFRLTLNENQIIDQSGLQNCMC